MELTGFAKRGGRFGGVDLGAAPDVAAGVAAGLVIGKLVGVVGACALAVRLGIASLPQGADWRGIVVVGTVAGIGFTMSLFIAGLAFAERPAKVGVLAASGGAAVLALILGRLLLPATPAPGAAATADDAEASTKE